MWASRGLHIKGSRDGGCGWSLEYGDSRRHKIVSRVVVLFRANDLVDSARYRSGYVTWQLCRVFVLPQLLMILSQGGIVLCGNHPHVYVTVTKIV